MNRKTFQYAVNDTERLFADYHLSREEILCVLAKVTTNAIHVIEEKSLRTWVELEYLRVLARFSETEERGQAYCDNETLKHHDAFIKKMEDDVDSCLGIEWDT